MPQIPGQGEAARFAPVAHRRLAFGPETGIHLRIFTYGYFIDRARWGAATNVSSN
jgi:hypothetical protein